jgi:catalase
MTGLPNYWPNSFHNLDPTSFKMKTKVDIVAGDVHRHDSGGEDNYSQVTDYWVRVLKEDERNRLVDNIAVHLKNAAAFLQERAINNFTKVHPDFGSKLRATLNKLDQVPFYIK